MSIFVSPLTIGNSSEIIYALWITAYYFTSNACSVQFLYRYLVLCRSMTLSFGRYFLMLILWALFCLPNGLWILIGGIVNHEALPQDLRQELAQTMTGAPNGTLQVISYAKVRKKSGILNILCRQSVN
jgi:hypothetical protein